MADFYYIDQGDVESYLQTALSDKAQDTFDLMLPLLQDTIDTYCNRTWNFTNPVTETFDAIADGASPHAASTFFVKYPSISTINSITIGGSPWDLTYAFNYKTHVKLQTGPGSFLLTTPLGFQSVVINYNSDAAQNPPKAVKAAFIQWIANMIQTGPDAGRDVDEVQTGTVRVRYSKDKSNEMPDFVKMVLEKYRLSPVDRF